MTAEDREPTTSPPRAVGRPVFPTGRGYSWPPFQPGHQVSLRHGAHTPSIIEPLAAELVVWLRTLADQRKSPIAFVAEEQFLPAVDRWARAEARRVRYEANVAEHGEFDKEGNERPEYRALKDWESRAAGHAARLGLDPLSLARIRRERAEVNQESEAEQASAELTARYGRPALAERA